MASNQVEEIKAGRVFEWLTVEYLSSELHPRTKQKMYFCTCKCGKTKYVTGAALRNGECKSCGCMKQELVRQRRVKGDEQKTK